MYKTTRIIYDFAYFYAVQIYSAELWVVGIFQFVVLCEFKLWQYTVPSRPEKKKKTQIADPGGVSCIGGSWGTLSFPAPELLGLCQGVSLKRNHKFPPQTKKLRNPKTCKRKSEFSEVTLINSSKKT